jgi:chitinase
LSSLIVLNFKGKLAKDRELGGVMVYALEMDDFKNLCGEGKNPLLNALRTAYGV